MGPALGFVWLLREKLHRMVWAVPCHGCVLVQAKPSQLSRDFCRADASLLPRQLGRVGPVRGDPARAPFTFGSVQACRLATVEVSVRVLANDFSDSALLLIGHGSTVNDDSAATTHQHAAAIRSRGIFAEVREAFFKIEPRIGAVLAAISQRRLFVVPLFVSEGYFTRQAIPCELGLPAGSQDIMPCRVEISGKQVIYCPPVGTHPLMTEIILARAREVLGAATSAASDEIALVIAGHGTALNADSRKSIERQVELIAARRLFAEVWPAFLEESPRIGEIPNFVQSKRVVVVPFFMSDGLHVREDIPVLLGETEATVQTRLSAGEWPWRNPTTTQGKEIYYTRGVGGESGIAEVILERVRDAASIFGPA